MIYESLVYLNINSINRGHRNMPELKINKFVDPAFYTDHDDIILRQFV